MILVKDEVLAKPDKSRVSGYVLVRNYEEQPTKKGSTYLLGVADAVGEVQFKIWRGSCFDFAQENNCKGKICLIEAEVNEFGGAKSLIVSAMAPVPEERLVTENLKEEDFVILKYDANAYWSSMHNIVAKNVSENAFKVFSLLIGEVEDDFKKEFAAIHHHDNCTGGLLAHSTRVMKMSAVIKQYPEITSRVSEDLLYVGSALHDIGKVVEYNKGTISEEGKRLSHLLFGCLMLEKHKSEIVELKGEEFYLNLLSVISQHHGEYGERPRTVAALVVHQIDLLESYLTSLDTTLSIVGAGEQISFDDMKLV